MATSSKSLAQEAKNSVTRRLDYILQVLRQNCLKDKDYEVFTTTRREEAVYCVASEVKVTFTDFKKCQNICNQLVEKLDDTVEVGSPVFFHSAKSLEKLRRQASLLATSNAKNKAQDMAWAVHQSLGRPLVVREDKCQEWEGTSKNCSGISYPDTTLQQKMHATYSVSCQVFAVFELLPKFKAKALR